jgi:RHS repeat-associated protein
MSRRIEKKVWQWQIGGGWGTNPVTHTKYVWDGWLLLEELNALSSNAVTKKYTWGLDLAGLNGSVNDRTSAGGVGGLLAMRVVSGSADYSYFYDANGNVGQMIQWSQSTAANAAKAKYEYDPYGNLLSSTGTAASSNDFRFSTKLLDQETGLYYYGYRYYSPKLGRWVTRDPLGEAISLGLYDSFNNSPTDTIDRLGLDWVKLNDKWDAQLNGWALQRWGWSWIEQNPAPWLGTFLWRGAMRSWEGDSYELSQSGAVHLFSNSLLFGSILAIVENNALLEANKLKCNPGAVTTNSVSGSYTFGPRGDRTAATWYYLSGYTYIIHRFSFMAQWNCYVEKRCWCCRDSSCGFQTRVRCVLDMKGWDKYDFAAGDSWLLQYVGRSYFIDFNASFRLRPFVTTHDCADGTAKPSWAW